MTDLPLEATPNRLLEHWLDPKINFLLALFLLLTIANYSFICSSLEEIWVTVLNITGPLSGWSFADGKLPGHTRPFHCPSL